MDAQTVKSITAVIGTAVSTPVLMGGIGLRQASRSLPTLLGAALGVAGGAGQGAAFTKMLLTQSRLPARLATIVILVGMPMLAAMFALVGQLLGSALVVGAPLGLLAAMADVGVDKLVFSSTCAVYGLPNVLPLTEDHPKAPISPYGHSKDLVETMLSIAREREGFRII